VWVALRLATLDWYSEICLLSGLALCLAAFVLMTYRIMRRRSLLSDPIYLTGVSYMLFIGVGPVLALSRLPLGLQADRSVHLKTLGISWIGVTSLLLGYTMSRLGARSVRAPSVFSLGRRFDNTTPNSDTILKHFGLGYTAIGLVGVVVYLHHVGGLTRLVQTTYFRREAAHLSTGISYDALRPGVVLLIAWTLGQRRTSTTWQAVLAACILFEVAWFGPIRGSRNQEFTLLLTVYFLLTGGRGARFVKLTTSVLMVAGVLTMLIWGAERGTKPVAQMSSGGADLVSEVAGTLYAPFDMLNKITWAVPDEMPYLKGASLIETATIWIPRACWAGKPRGLGWDLNDIYYGTIRGGNSVPTWPGELYWDFGVIGVIAGMFVMGVVCARLARLNRPYVVGRGFPVTRTLYAVSYPIFLVWVWAGSSEAMWYLLENILPVYVACRIAMRRASVGSTRSSPSSGVTALREQSNNTRF
jgi:hypothetical protein